MPIFKLFKIMSSQNIEQNYIIIVILFLFFEMFMASGWKHKKRSSVSDGLTEQGSTCLKPDAYCACS